jgi:hypothetical protein
MRHPLAAADPYIHNLPPEIPEVGSIWSPAVLHGRNSWNLIDLPAPDLQK